MRHEKGLGAEGLSEILRHLRTARGLGLSELARHARLSEGSLRDWETGRHAPTARALDALLAALGVESRPRARLLATVGSREVRDLLAHTPWGAPVDLGAVLRAMRVRHGGTQADVARTVGVRQGTLAKWEAGDAQPAPETRNRLLTALKANPEETAAFETAIHGPPTPGLDAHERLAEIAHDRPIALRDVLLLGLESELWARAMHDPRLDAPLARTLAVRAQQSLLRGARVEVAPHVRRAARLAHHAREPDPLAPGLYALNWLRQRNPGEAMAAARSLGRAAAQMRDPGLRDWLTAAEALALVRAGEIDAGVRPLEAFLAREGLDAAGRRYHGEDLVEAWLLAGEPERAAEALDRLGDDVTPVAAAKVAAAKGQNPPPDLLAQLRASDWVNRQEALRIERLASQVRRGGRPRLR